MSSIKLDAFSYFIKETLLLYQICSDISLTYIAIFTDVGHMLVNCTIDESHMLRKYQSAWAAQVMELLCMKRCTLLDFVMSKAALIEIAM